jgi:hypothetical protein
MSCRCLPPFRLPLSWLFLFTATLAAGWDYPADEWSRAGVASGIPTGLPVAARANPGDDLQALIDAAPADGGVIALAAGRYRLEQTLRLRSGIVLRGTGQLTTVIELDLRSDRPADLRDPAPAEWTAGLRLEGVQNAGVMNLTLVFGSALPPPSDPAASPQAFTDNPGGRADLHVVSVLLHRAVNCWVSNCGIQNSGSHPLVVADSRHITLENLELTGAHNRGPGSGSLALIGSEAVLVTGLQARAINSVVLQSVAAPCRGNVFLHARFETDLRLHGTATTANLFENCIITIPDWLNRPPFSPGNAKAREAPPGPDNLLHLCTVTRHFRADRRVFSLADDPAQVYRVVDHPVRDGASPVVIAGPAPNAPSLLPAR